jgi:hypothetical protein
VREGGNPGGRLEMVEVEGRPLLSGFEFIPRSFNLMNLNPSLPNDPNSADEELLISSEHDFLEVETDLTQISALLTENPDLLGGEDIAELLERLNNTESMAQSMEDKLDVVLQNLDTLLTVLDKRDSLQNVEEIAENGDIEVDSSKAAETEPSIGKPTHLSTSTLH